MERTLLGTAGCLVVVLLALWWSGAFSPPHGSYAEAYDNSMAEALGREMMLDGLNKDLRTFGAAARIEADNLMIKSSDCDESLLQGVVQDATVRSMLQDVGITSMRCDRISGAVVQIF